MSKKQTPKQKPHETIEQYTERTNPFWHNIITRVLEYVMGEGFYEGYEVMPKPKVLPRGGFETKVSKLLSLNTFQVKNSNTIYTLAGVSIPPNITPTNQKKAFYFAKKNLENKPVYILPHNNDFCFVFRSVVDETGCHLLVNDYLIRQGYAVSGPTSEGSNYHKALSGAEKAAEHSKRGLWPNYSE